MLNSLSQDGAIPGNVLDAKGAQKRTTGGTTVPENIHWQTDFAGFLELCELTSRQ